MSLRPNQTLLAPLCVASLALALSACSSTPGSDSGKSAASPTASSQQSQTPKDDSTSSSFVSQIDPSSHPSVPAPPKPTPSAPWTPAEITFVNEDASVWYQDQSVVREGADTGLEETQGYRTYDGKCFGYITRNTSEETHNSSLSDPLLSSAMVSRDEESMSSVVENPEEAVSLVRDDGGTLEGYSMTYTASFNWDDGTSDPVEGYKFARVVKDSGFSLGVLVTCRQGHNLSTEQWHTLLKGIRVQGLSGGTMK